ncbi:MAG: Ig-like domain-containing protein [Flavobacteriales bacterium]|nr:Ig-like domain-containing protein [Flavobacteriales bacterium]
MYYKQVFLKYFLIFSIATLLFACAQIVAPTGGPIDKTAPVVESFSPENKSTAYEKGTPLIIEFDEYVSLNIPLKNVSISPPISENLEFLLKGKSIITKINADLKTNTTYTINFSSAIKDITEGNPLPNLEYVFSTGNTVDSAHIKGKIIDAFTSDPAVGVKVFAYHSIADSVPYKELPSYLDVTNDSGYFKIPNMKPGKYKLFALIDGDNNLMFNITSEEVAFIDGLISTTDTTEQIMSLFKEDKDIQFVKKITNEGKKVKIAFNRPTQNMQVVSKYNDHHYFSENKDTLIMWINRTLKEDISVELFDGDFQDTIAVSFKELADSIVKVTANHTKSKKFDFYKPFKFSFSHLINKYDPTKIILTENSDTVEFSFVPSEVEAYENLEFNYTWKDSAKYQIHINPGAFTSLYGLANDTSMIQFSTRSRAYYNISTLQIQGVEENQACIMQLFTDKAMISEDLIIGSQTIIYNYLPAGEYKLKLIYDDNKNGKWDTGNYLEKVQPEKIVVYHEGLKIKSGWETETIWEVE